MPDNYSNRILTLKIFILTMLLTCCLGEQDKSTPDILFILDPSEISQDLLNKILFFEKNVKDISIFSIVTVDLKQKETYLLSDEGNQLNISPNKKLVTFIRSESIGKLNPHRVWVFDLQTRQETKLVGWSKDMMDIWLSNPSFSKDSEKIIFTIAWIENGINGLATVNIDGTDLKILNTNLPLNEGAIYSPNGELIIVTCAGVDEETGQLGFQLCLLDNNGLYRKHLTNRGVTHGSRAFTPDGNRIVYQEYEDGGIFGIINRPENNFYIMDNDGSNKILLLDWIVDIKAISNDGEEIIFVGRRNRSFPRGIYIMNIDGTNLRQLVYFDEFLEEWYSDIEEY